MLEMLVLDRFKVMCERRLAFAVDAGSVVATQAIAEQHGCARFKAKYVEFIAGGSRENLNAVLETDGFKDLEVTLCEKKLKSACHV